jgi:hypothetical protein
VTPVFDASATTLACLLHEIAVRAPPAEPALDAAAGEAAPYRPVPTIVEAATMLYSRHSVAEIAAARRCRQSDPHDRSDPQRDTLCRGR